MPSDNPRPFAHITLALCTLLHGFTHAFATMLVPLYLMIAHDFELRGVGAASLVVTVYGLVYCLGSYVAGVLADRWDRKTLLGVGLLGNAVAIIAMGLTRQYEVMLALGVVAGLFGTLFHPAANALATAHYPKSPGMAVGIMGIGAGLGFFAGPQYAGWRAETAQWTWGSIAAWQRPCIELGIAGAVVGVIFLLLAREAAARGQTRALDIEHPALGARLSKLVLALAGVLGLRDFAGIASMSLLSIYLQKAHGYNVKQAGLVIGGMMLISVVVNPIAVWVTPGRRRLPALAFVLAAGGVVIATVPLWPVVYVLPVMALFQAFQLGSYAIADAAVLERVSPAVRGRVIGLFLMAAGTFASLSPWAMGFWTDMLRVRAAEPMAYLPLFGTLGAMMLLSALCPPIIARLGARQPPEIQPFSETLPATVEPLG